MLFLIQNDNNTGIEFELWLTRFLVSQNRMGIHDFYMAGLNDIPSLPVNIGESVPVGTIDFVTAWLDRFHGIKRENPIEVPACLRKKEFLKRDYRIVKAEDVPREGEYFIKDASVLKSFSFSGNLKWFFSSEIPGSMTRLDSSRLYQVSEIVNIISEYRVYIMDGKIRAMVCYAGNPCIFPDAGFIQKANSIYSCQKDYPLSYSMDVMITEKGTSLIEIHNFTSIGLYYSLFGDELLYAYRDGISYLLEHNTPPSEFTELTD